MKNLFLYLVLYFFIIFFTKEFLIISYELIIILGSLIILFSLINYLTPI